MVNLPSSVSDNDVALEKLLQQGFPGPHQTGWRYTDMRALANRQFVSASQATATVLASITTEAVSDYQIVFVNGYFEASLSHLPSMITLTPLTTSDTLSENDIFAQLNQSFCQQHWQITITDDCQQPITIFYIATVPDWIQPRIVIKVNARAIIYEKFMSEVASVTNIVRHIEIVAGAQLDYIQCQQEQMASWQINRIVFTVHADAALRSHYYAIGSAVTRHEMTILLQNSGANVELYGLYSGCQRQHLDQQTTIIHAAPQTQSLENYHGVLQDQARAVFNGKIIVKPEAPYSIAAQNNHNLLLSSQAEINTKPELEIYQDEVKCTHGATVGQLDEVALFYLRARGIDEITARHLLLQSFVEKIIAKITNDAIAQQIRSMVKKRW